MANTTITPNMNLPSPNPTIDPGPDWATNNFACMSAIDSHNHTPGQGVQITPSGLNISSDLAMNGNNLTTARSVNFTAQGSPLAAVTDIGCIYVSGADLYYNDEAGNQVRITQSGSVTGSTGTITGLPSGTASASYSAGTFTFKSATSTPATMAVGPVVIGRAVASSKTVTLTPNSGQAADYGLTFPASLPGSTSILSLDTSGNIASLATTGSGSAVLATSASLTSPTIANPTVTTGTFTTPNFSGIPTGTITSGAYTPSRTNSLGSATVTPFSFYYTRIGNRITVNGNVVASSNSSGLLQYTLDLPIDPTNNFTATYQVVGGAFMLTSTSAGTSAFYASATIGARTVTVFFSSPAASSISCTHNIYFTYDCT